MNRIDSPHMQLDFVPLPASCAPAPKAWPASHAQMLPAAASTRLPHPEEELGQGLVQSKPAAAAAARVCMRVHVCVL